MCRAPTRVLCSCAAFLLAAVWLLATPGANAAAESLRVAVMGEPNELLPDAALVVTNELGETIKLTAGTDGTFLIVQPGQKVRLEATHPDFGVVSHEVVIPPSSSSLIVIRMADGSLYLSSADATTAATSPAQAFRAAPMRQGGDTCATATVIGGLPFSGGGTTVGFNDDYDEICPFDTPGSPDVVYEYTPAVDQLVNISLCGNSAYDTKLYVYANSCGPYQGGTAIACNDDACSTPSFPLPFVSELDVLLTGGTTYYIVVDGYGPEAGDYTIDVTEIIPCDVICPPDATPENEPDCGVPDDFVNGGCNSSPPVFTPIACGETICGTAAFDGSTRDTDWYEITVTEPQVFTFEVEAEFPVLFGLVEPIVPGLADCSNLTGSVNPAGFGDPCSPLAVTTGILPAGTYWFFVAPLFEDPFPCGAEYTATLTCEAAPTTGACCFPDGSCADGVTEDECAGLGGAFQGLGTDCDTVFCPVVPDNDLCFNAIGPLELFSVTSGTTIGATVDDEYPTCGTSISAAGVWYTVIGTGNTMTATTCEFQAFPGAADYDTKISVFCTCDVDGDPLCVAGNDDEPGCNLHSTVTWCSQAGHEYLILVHGFGSAEGFFDLAISDDGIPCVADVECIPTGACCFPDVFGTCEVLTEDECLDLGGSYQGDGTNCGVFEYVVEECDEDLIDISDTGFLGPDGDDNGAVIPIGFTFSFYEVDHTEIGVSTNGYLTFGPDLTDFSNDVIPNELDPNDLIAPLWDDYVVDDGKIFYETIGMEPNRMLVVTWSRIRQFADSDENTFQAILHEGSNCIEYRYGDFSLPTFADDKTIGVESPDGTTGVGVPDTEVFPGDCLRFCPVPPENPCPVVLALDIKPGSCPNSFNTNSQGNGVVPVAIAGSMDFDVMMIDVSSLLISRSDGVGGSVAPLMGPPGPGVEYDDVTEPYYVFDCMCIENMPDGIMDLSLKFRRSELIEMLELEDVPGNGLIELTVTGTLMDGRAFEASDCIRIVPVKMMQGAPR